MPSVSPIQAYRARSCVITLLALLVLAACDDTAPSYTAVYVAIDADAYVQERAASYRIATARDELVLKATDLPKPPFFVTVEPGPKGDTRGELSVTALDGQGATIVRRQAELSLLEGKQRRIEVLLTRFCSESYRACEARALSCDGCACISRELDVASLSLVSIDAPLVGVEAPSVCADAMDASVDGSIGNRDASLDGDAGAHDAGSDAGDAAQPVDCTVLASDDSTCDGVNDDCDGETDEDATLGSCVSFSVPAVIATGHCAPVLIDLGALPGKLALTVSPASASFFTDSTCTTQLSPAEVTTASASSVFIEATLAAGEYAANVDVTLGTGSDALTQTIEVRRAARHITAGAHHTCAELDDDSLWCWGEREEINTSQVPPVVARPKRLTTVNGLSAGTTRSGIDGVCWVTPAGAVDCSGAIAANNEPTSGVEQIAMTGGHVCALSAGAVSCWGNNDYGELGASVTLGDDSTTPLAVSFIAGAIALEIAVGWDHSCALLDDAGTDAVYCWGRQGYLGDGLANSNARVPRLVSGLPSNANLTDLVSDAYTTCVLADSKVYCWGNGSKGQVGPSGAASNISAVAVSSNELADVKSLEVSDAGVCAILADDTFRCWGGNEALELGATELALHRATPGVVAGVPARVEAVTLGGGGGWGHGCALSAGLVSCWGRDDAAQTATSKVLGRFTSATPASGGLMPTALAMGASATCAIVGGQAYCWGQEQRDGYDTEILGSNPDLNAEYNDNRDAPFPVADASGLTYTGLAAVGNGMCAIRDGKVVCWGRVNFTGSQASPVEVFAPAAGSVTKISGGQSHFCALVSGGTSGGVWCRGLNSSGQVGDPGSSGSTGPYQVFDGNAGVLDIVTTINGSGAVFADHLEWWGAEHPSAGAASATPTVVNWDEGTERSFVAAAADDYGLCVLLSDYEVYCKGGDVGGNGIDGSPELTGGAALASGRNNVCARTTSNELACLGMDTQGQLGNGSAGVSAGGDFVAVEGLVPPVTAFATGDAACAVDADGLKCWGDNYARQLLQPGAPFRAAPALIIPWEDP